MKVIQVCFFIFMIIVDFWIYGLNPGMWSNKGDGDQNCTWSNFEWFWTILISQNEYV